MADKVIGWNGSPLAGLVPSNLLAAATIKGKIVGIPSTVEAFGLLYNKAVLDKAGVDPTKIALLQNGEIPFYEPGLDTLLAEQVKSGRLTFTSNFSDVKDCDVHFLCVGTPQIKDGLAADLTYVNASLEMVGAIAKDGALVVGKSTVPVGTAARLRARLVEINPEADLAWNPEFLREGFAVEDTLHPNRLVVGVTNDRAENILKEVYAANLAENTPWVRADLPTAELVKVAANSFLATKISFINAMAEICEAAGGDVTVLAKAIGYDPRIGNRFLQAGIGFGGGKSGVVLK